jgi:hypothetical protein
MVSLMFLIIGFFYYRNKSKSLEERIEKTSESTKAGCREIYSLYTDHIEIIKMNWYNRGQFSQEILISLEPLKNILIENPEIFTEEYFYGYRLITMQKLMYLAGYISKDRNMSVEELSDFTLESGLSLEYWEDKLLELSKSKSMNLFINNLNKYKVEFVTDDDFITDGYFFLKVTRDNKALSDIRKETGNPNMKIYGTSDLDTLYVGLLDYSPESYRHNNIFLKVNDELSFCVIFGNLIEHYKYEEQEKINLPNWFRYKL